MALATEMPIAMMAPMNDCTFSVVPVTSSINSTPQITAGTRRDDREGEPERLEVRRQQQEDDDDGQQQAGAQARQRLLERRHLAAS